MNTPLFLTEIFFRMHYECPLVINLIAISIAHVQFKGIVIILLLICQVSY